MPKIIASVVIRIGRSRTWPASRMRLAHALPSRMPWLVKSTSRIAFLVTRPISMMKPMIEKMLSVVLVSSQRQQHADQRQRQRHHDRDRLQEAAELRGEHQVDEDHRQAQRGQRRGGRFPSFPAGAPPTSNR